MSVGLHFRPDATGHTSPAGKWSAPLYKALWRVEPVPLTLCPRLAAFGASRRMGRRLHGRTGRAMRDYQISGVTAFAYLLIGLGLVLSLWFLIPSAPNINGLAVWCTGIGLLLRVRAYLGRIQCDKLDIFEAGRAVGRAEAMDGPGLRRVH